MDNCKVIAVTNQKGGVGKTTTTLNLAVGLANRGHHVLAIDADPQASLSVSLGKPNADELDTTLATILHAVIEDEEIPNSLGILHHDEGIDFLPANIELASLETGLINVMRREYVLRDYLDDMRLDYDYILIDCMPSLGLLTINALAAADSVIIPSQPSYLSAKGLNLLLHSIAKVRRSINPQLKIDGVLLTMVDGRTNNAKAIAESLRNGLGQSINIFNTEIPLSVRAVECSITGKSIYTHDKCGKVAQAYENLTKEVAELEHQSRLRSWNDRAR